MFGVRGGTSFLSIIEMGSDPRWGRLFMRICGGWSESGGDG
jgi:hypothetical protein